jgi:tRNA dimethylallyltransferase
MASIGPLVVIVGETASGKSALGIELAQLFDGEIIAADAMTAYKGFNIGTAKPTPEEQAKIKHHLLDVADAGEGFSAAKFQKMAYEAIHDIHKRKKIPFMVGGSGLYIDSVLFDYGFMPQNSPDFRMELESMSLEELHESARAGGFDLDAIDKQNKRRVIRLIENSGLTAAQNPLRENTLVLGVSKERYELLHAVDKRVAHMIELGLEREARQLSDTYGWNVEPMRSIGYREWHAYFDGSVDLEQVKQQIIMDTMRLAKKQRTWFKRNKSIHWIHESSEAVGYTTTFLDK